MKRIVFLPFLFLLFSPLCFGGEWFVAPNGDDGGPGTRDKPFATLVRARDAVRAAKTTDAGPHTVRIAPGVYELAEPLVLDHRDSGTAERPVRYIGTGAQTILSGGRPLDGWKKESDEIWSVILPKENGRDLYFEQLFINGRRAVRARTPNNGFFRPQDVWQDLPINTQQSPRGTTEQAIMPQKGDLDFLKTTPQEELRFGQFVVHHNWDTTRRILLGYDTENDLLLMKGQPMQFWNPWRINSLYYIENVRAAFDEPGEWFYDGVNHKALYRPLPGEKLEACRFIVPRSGMNQLLLVQGTPEQRAAHIHFEKITFAYTDSPRREDHMRAAELDPKVTGDLNYPGPSQTNPMQAAFWTNAVIDIENADGISITDSEITNIGEYAVWMKNSDHCRVERCAMTELGAGGVRIGGKGSSKFNVVDNCIIHRGGRLHASCVAIWLGQGTEDNQITHNDIGDFYYTAISLGWVWGYRGGVCFNNRVMYNRLHDLGQGALADMGGVYTLGNQKGTQVSNNVIFNVLSYSYGGWGLYPDEGSEGLLMENNLVYDTSSGTFHQHYGKDNIVRNNILAFSSTDQLQRSRVEEHISFVLENNIILWDEGVLFGHPWTKDYFSCWGDDKVVIRKNLYWNPNIDMTKAFPSRKPGELTDLATWQKESNHDGGSIIADPKFVDPKNRDFRLKDDSPAKNIGFVPFDFSKAGVYGDEAWIQRVASFVTPVHPNVPPEPKPLPLKVVDGFETARREPILKGVANDEGKNLIRLSKDRPAQGEYCLEVMYALNLRMPYDPHFFYVPIYEQGTVRVAFSLRTQANAEFEVEMRDNSERYKVGPRFHVAKGKLLVDGQEQVVFPIDEWVRYEIVTHVGDSSTGDWTLRLTFADGTKKEFNGLKFRNADWKSLNWFGFSNSARTADRTTYFLDDIEIANQE